MSPTHEMGDVWGALGLFSGGCFCLPPSTTMEVALQDPLRWKSGLATWWISAQLFISTLAMWQIDIGVTGSVALSFSSRKLDYALSKDHLPCNFLRECNLLFPFKLEVNPKRGSRYQIARLIVFKKLLHIFCFSFCISAE